MTNEEAKKMLKAKLECLKNETSGINYDCNMRLCDGCSLNYEQGNMGEQKEALDMAIKALEQQPITWIVGKNNCQVAVRNMPIDKMQKICAIIGEEEQQPCEGMRDATEEERKSTKDYIDSISKPTGLRFDDIYEELDFVQPHKKISVNLQFCDDCISRAEAIKETKALFLRNFDSEYVVEMLKTLPSVTPKGVTITDFADRCRECGNIKSSITPKARWIPVSERLPELGERVLCQCRANIYEVLKLTVDGWYYNPNHCYMESFVIAWMPLPQPYKEEQDGKNNTDND